MMFKILTPARDRQNRVLTETGTRRQMGAESERQGKGKMMRQEAESQPPNENEGVWETARDKDKATEREGHTETERQEKGVGREMQRDKQTQGEQDRRGGGEGERQRLEEDGQKHENVTERAVDREKEAVAADRAKSGTRGSARCALSPATRLGPRRRPRQVAPS